MHPTNPSACYKEQTHSCQLVSRLFFAQSTRKMTSSQSSNTTVSQATVLQWMLEYCLAERFDEITDNLIDILVQEHQLTMEQLPLPTRLRLCIASIRGTLDVQILDTSKSKRSAPHTLLYLLKQAEPQWQMLCTLLDGISNVESTSTVDATYTAISSKYYPLIDPITQPLLVLAKDKNFKVEDYFEKYTGQELDAKTKRHVELAVEQLLQYLVRVERSVGLPQLQQYANDSNATTTSTTRATKNSSNNKPAASSSKQASKTPAKEKPAAPAKSTPKQKEATKAATTPKASTSTQTPKDKQDDAPQTNVTEITDRFEFTLADLREAAKELGEDEWDLVEERTEPSVVKFLRDASDDEDKVKRVLRSASKKLTETDPLPNVLQQVQETEGNTTAQKWTKKRKLNNGKAQFVETIEFDHTAPQKASSSKDTITPAAGKRVLPNDDDESEEEVEEEAEDKNKPTLAPVKKAPKAPLETRSAPTTSKTKTSPVEPKKRRKSDSDTHRKKIPFSDDENKCLLRGVKNHGTGSWAAILQNPLYKFNEIRTSTSLRDRYRIMEKNGLVKN